MPDQPNPTDPTPPDPTPAPPDAEPVPADLATLQAEAAAAAQRAEDLAARLEQTEATLTQTREALDAAERRREIDRQLAEADALDLETARLMTEAALSAMDEADVAAAIADLRERKPFLFARAGAPWRARTAPAAPGADGDCLSAIAERAAASGDRASLIEYLRARRELTTAN